MAQLCAREVICRVLRKFLGFPGGMLKDTDDLMAKVAVSK